MVVVVLSFLKMEFYLEIEFFTADKHDISIYYPTAFRRVQITPKTSENITRYFYSRGPVRNSPART